MRCLFMARDLHYGTGIIDSDRDGSETGIDYEVRAYEEDQRAVYTVFCGDPDYDGRYVAEMNAEELREHASRFLEAAEILED